MTSATAQNGSDQYLSKGKKCNQANDLKRPSLGHWGILLFLLRTIRNRHCTFRHHITFDKPNHANVSRLQMGAHRVKNVSLSSHYKIISLETVVSVSQTDNRRSTAVPFAMLTFCIWLRSAAFGPFYSKWANGLNESISSCDVKSAVPLHRFIRINNKNRENIRI